MALTTGFIVGYLAGAAAGRPAYERIRTRAASVASEFGLVDASQRLKERGDDLARASADLASTATREAVDNATNKVEDSLAEAKAKITSTTPSTPATSSSTVSSAGVAHNGGGHV